MSRVTCCAAALVLLFSLIAGHLGRLATVSANTPPPPATGVDPVAEEDAREVAASTTSESVAGAAVAAGGSAAATVETSPVRSSGDAADDSALWIHPSDPTRSTVIGTDKQAGIAVYGLDGREIQYRADGKLNNIDLRYNVPLAGQAATIVAASNRSNGSIALYRVDESTGTLANIAARTIYSGSWPYGLCMYRSPVSGTYYVFVNSSAGEVEQWALFDNGSGKLDAKRVRSFSVGSKTEGCVADDVHAFFYIAEEDVGIWKYGAEPGAGTSRVMVDRVGTGGHLTADVEGLTIYYMSTGAGYLLASSQGNNSYVAYHRDGSNSYVTTFQVGAGNGIDGVSHTDGIDVTNVNLGSAFPAGVFVAQDSHNDGLNQNFKLVPWPAIVDATGSLLRSDTTWNPRAAGATHSSTPTPTATPSATASSTPTPTPTSSSGVTLPGRFEVEDYSSGGQGTGYYDTTSGNSGGKYRSDDVDIQSTTDSTGSYNVGWIAAGEWLAYNVSVGSTGEYVFRVRVATPYSSKRLHLEVDGVDVTGPLAIPNTGGWQTWTDVASGPIRVIEGPHVVKIVADTGGFNLNYVSVTAAASTTPTSTPTPTPSPTATSTTTSRVPLPGRFEVEDYRSGGQGTGYYDTTSGNSGGKYRSDDVDIQSTTDSTGSYGVGWIAAGEWLAYDVTVESSTNYSFTVRAATPYSGKSFHIEVDGVNVSGPIALPNTGGWQTWTNVSSAPLALSAGNHTLKLVADTGSFNLNYITVVKPE